MQFTTNPYPRDTEFNPDSSWVLLERPANSWWTQIKAFPFVLINMGVVILVFLLFGINFTLHFNTLILSFLIFIPLHEFIHALTFPVPISSKDIYLGFSLKEFVPFAAYTGKMTRTEALWNLLAPFTITTVFVFGLLIFFPENSLLKHIALFNAMASCVDSMDAFRILKCVPKDALLKEHLENTYWQKVIDSKDQQPIQ
jgi:hypothetical protein